MSTQAVTKQNALLPVTFRRLFQNLEGLAYGFQRRPLLPCRNCTCRKRE